MSGFERNADAVVGITSDLFDDLDRRHLSGERPRFVQGVGRIVRRDHGRNCLLLRTLIEVSWFFEAI